MVNWRGRRESENVEDRRGDDADAGGGFSFPGRQMGGPRMPFPMPGGGGRGGVGILGLLIVLGLMLLFGVDPRTILGGGGGNPQVDSGDTGDSGSSGRFDIPSLPGTKPDSSGNATTGGPSIKPSDDLKSFVSVVLADTEDVWGSLFQSFGKEYRQPKMVLYSGGTQTACGPGQSAMGPFYCPIDEKVYVDLSFYEEMRTRFGAPGDFAQAYVIAHEVGHHVQKLLGIADKVTEYKQQVDERTANRLQVMMELQADCLAGVWANQDNRLHQLLQQGDIEEGLNAASAIGDDRLQKQATGRVVPDAFTHGSSAQRVRWFKQGLDSGNIKDCDTFNANPL